MSPRLRRFGIYCLFVCQFKEGCIWALIASVPDLCILFYFFVFYFSLSKSALVYLMSGILVMSFWD